MHTFTHNRVLILPHAEAYRKLYGISIADVLTCVNSPDLQEGLATDKYTAEKQVGLHRIYVYYYHTLPFQGKPDDLYAIVDFIGYSTTEDGA